MKISINIDLEKIDGYNLEYPKGKLDELEKAKGLIEEKTKGSLGKIGKIGKIDEIMEDKGEITKKELIKEAKKEGIGEEEVMEIIDKLKRAGNIFEPSSNTFQHI